MKNSVPSLSAHKFSRSAPPPGCRLLCTGLRRLASHYRADEVDLQDQSAFRARNGLPIPSRRPVPGQRMVRGLTIEGGGQGDWVWTTERFERLWIAIGPPPMRTTSRRSTTFIERTRCSNIRSRANASAGGGRFSRLAPLSRTENASPCGE